MAPHSVRGLQYIIMDESLSGRGYCEWFILIMNWGFKILNEFSSKQETNFADWGHKAYKQS